MKINFNKQTLIDALTPALGCVSDKNTLPSIEGILFYASNSGVTISSYDLEKGYKANVDAEVIEGGSYIFDADKIYKIVKAMPEDSVLFEVDTKNSAKITSGVSEFKMVVTPGTEFPALPDLNVDVKYILSQSNLKTMIGQIAHAIAVNDSRAALNGANFVIESGSISLVSCDGNRLAIRKKNSAVALTKAEGEAETASVISFIIPGKTLSELMKILAGGDDEVGIAIGRKHIIFKMGDTILFSRVIDGDFIDVDRVLPKGSKINVKVWREALIESLERASLVSDDGVAAKNRSYVKCVFEPHKLKISATSSVSSVYEEIPIVKTGDDLTIGFNCKFLLDALKNATGDELSLSLFAPLTSVIISASEQKDDESYLYMVCPVRMRE